MPKVLIVTNHRKDRSPGQRFRFEQYLDELQRHGYEIDFSYFINADDDKLFYSPGNYGAKARIMLKNFALRSYESILANHYDIIFIFREATMVGTAVFEKWMSLSRAKLIFDFDDSIWLENVSEANKNLSFLKNYDKTGEIIEVCDMVFAGNAYLAEYAGRYCRNVKIIPTTIDTEEYQRMALPSNGKVCIGWSGSVTTIQHFRYAIPALQEVKAKYGDRIEIKVIGDANYRNDELQLISKGWNKQDELKELSSFDIGIMPLPDDLWSRGKCGLKGLQYMALEIPTIMSPVGVNTEIIRDGENGFLAVEKEEWVDKICRLVEDADLRKRMGLAGRQTVMEEYSVLANKPKYIAAFDELMQLPKRR